jgi:hypothetical protein
MLTLAIVVAAFIGCADKKSDDCKAAFGRLVELTTARAKAAGKSGDAARLSTPEARAQFVAKCAAWSPELVSCLGSADKARTPACQELMKQNPDVKAFAEP